MRLEQKAREYLETLCIKIPNRRVGSRGNREATTYFADRLARFDWEVHCPGFNCMDWRAEGAGLRVGEETFSAQVSPYSLGGEIRAPLVRVSSLADLETADLTGKIVLVDGELAKEQLMPKNFVFYNPDHHQKIIGLLEAQAPEAIVAATTMDPGLAGAVYPFPLIEDGDFDIPSVYMTAEEGERIAGYVGEEVFLAITAQRRPATGCNVIGRKGQFNRGKYVISAHIDAKDGTPGAVDNGTGVVVLLLLAEMLRGYSADPGVEMVAFNGEDYYAASGEMLYLQENQNKFGEVKLAVNIDGVGYKMGKTAFSFYGCLPAQEALIRQVFAAREEFVLGEPWYQSDHTLFIQQKVPALALTSDQFTALWTEIAHTPRDHPNIVDYRKLVRVAEALQAILEGLQGVDA